MSDLQFTWLKRNEEHPRGEPLLAVEDLIVRVGARRVLDGISLNVFSGDHLRITGPNGCGKSTLLNAIAGVGPARIERGLIRFQGADVTGWPAHERARSGIAYMRQIDNVFTTLTVNENLLLSVGPGGYEEFAQAFPTWTSDLGRNRRAGQLSGGQRKKLAWAMNVLRSTPVLLADEPNAGVAQDFAAPAATVYIVVTHQH